MEIWIKVIFAILLVIFVAFIMINVFSSKSATLQQQEHFDLYDQTSRILMSIFSNPYCIGIARFVENSSQGTAVGMLSVEKLDLLTDVNQDYYCVENYFLIYSMVIEDIETGNQWTIGLQNTDPRWAERKFTNSFPVGLMYGPNEVHVGLLSFYAFTGEFPYFYGKIKQACLTNDDIKYNIDFRYDIDYNATLNRMCVGTPSKENCFSPYFSCAVGSFYLQNGGHLVLMKHGGDGIEII